MIVPSGAPHWSLTNTFANYGGDTNKASYAGIDPLGGGTDLSPNALNRLATDMSAACRTMPICVINYTSRYSQSLEPAVNYCALPSGVYSGAPYDGGSPPNGFPTVTEDPNSLSTITLPSSFTDPYGVSGSVTVTFAVATIGLSATKLPYVTARIYAGNVILVRASDINSSLREDVQITVVVW
jgi:hypothetical protein